MYSIIEWVWFELVNATSAHGLAIFLAIKSSKSLILSAMTRFNSLHLSVDKDPSWSSKLNFVTLVYKLLEFIAHASTIPTADLKDTHFSARVKCPFYFSYRMKWTRFRINSTQSICIKLNSVSIRGAGEWSFIKDNLLNKWLQVYSFRQLVSTLKLHLSLFMLKLQMLGTAIFLILVILERNKKQLQKILISLWIFIMNEGFITNPFSINWSWKLTSSGIFTQNLFL